MASGSHVDEVVALGEKVFGGVEAIDQVFLGVLELPVNGIDADLVHHAKQDLFAGDAGGTKAPAVLDGRKGSASAGPFHQQKVHGKLALVDSLSVHRVSIEDRMGPTQVPVDGVGGLGRRLRVWRLPHGLGLDHGEIGAQGVAVGDGFAHWSGEAEDAFGAAGVFEFERDAVDGVRRDGGCQGRRLLLGSGHHSLDEAQALGFGRYGREPPQADDLVGPDRHAAGDRVKHGAARKLIQAVAEKDGVRRWGAAGDAWGDGDQQTIDAAGRQVVEVRRVGRFQRGATVELGSGPIAQAVEGHKKNAQPEGSFMGRRHQGPGMSDNRA